MNTNTIEMTAITTLTQLNQVAAPNEVIRELADAELFLVGGGTGEVTWNTPVLPNP